MSEDKKQNEHYVNNAQFSQAVVDYVQSVEDAVAAGKPAPVVTNYIAQCFLSISERLSHKSNFVRYTYRDEMVADAVENCLRAIRNYNIEAATRTGRPNAFGYFTQIAMYAFLRRIQKEKKQQEIKMKYITQASHEHYVNDADVGDESNMAAQAFVSGLVERFDNIDTDKFDKKEEPEKEPTADVRKKRAVKADSDLSQHFVD